MSRDEENARYNRRYGGRADDLEAAIKEACAALALAITELEGYLQIPRSLVDQFDQVLDDLRDL